MNADSIQKVVDLAMANEARIPRDLKAAILKSFEPGSLKKKHESTDPKLISS